MVVDRPKDGTSDAIVVGRDWEHLDLVDDLRYPFDPLDDALNRGTECGPRNLACECHCRIPDLKGEVVEHAVVGERHQFVTHLAFDALQLRRSQTGYEQGSQGQ